jgi:hypothetical protein
MKQLKPDHVEQVSGGLDPRFSETQLAPEPQASDPLVVIDYAPPPQPQ